MKILKRTSGIDLKAKNSSLHGSVVIQFRDPITGKVTDEERHDNFFTDALKSVLNGCPFGMDNAKMMFNDVFSTDGVTKTGSMFEWLLGGILLFPQSLGSDATELYAPFTNYPTAMASMASFEHRSNKQGYFNAAESAALSDGGYRYVYDWGTSQGTGNIASVALSHRRCYEYFNDGAIPFFPMSTNTSSGGGGGYRSDYFGGAQNERVPLAICETGILTTTNRSTSDWLKCRFYKVAPFNFRLLQSLNGGIPEYLSDNVTRPLEFAWETDLASYFSGSVSASYLSYQFDNGVLYAWQKNSAGTADIKVITIDLVDGSVLTQNTYRFAAPNSPTSGTSQGRRFAIKNGYLYIPSSVAGKIYKCNFSNEQDVTEINCNAIANDNCWATNSGSNIYGQGFVLNSDIGSDMSVINQNYNAGMSQFYGGRNIVYENGVWIVSCSSLGGVLNAQIKTPYLATKNNLDSVKTKTSDKTMKVIYTVTQV